MFAVIEDPDTGEAYADIRPADPEPWTRQVLRILNEQRARMKLPRARVGMLLGVPAGTADDMLHGEHPITLWQVERLAAAMGLRFDPPSVRPII